MPNEFDWRKYGENYPEVDERLGGLPGFLREIGKRWQEGKAKGSGPIERLIFGGKDVPILQAAQRGIVNPMSAATTGAANMLLGGLPSAVAGRVAPEYAAAQRTVRAENPIATGIGQGAGLAGAVLAPTAAASAGLQLGPAGAGLGQTIARNALISSAYAAPATGAQAMETGNVPKALLRGGLSALLGTAIGTGAEKIVGPMIQKAATNARLRSWGIRPADIRKALRGGAKAAGITGEGAQSMSIKQAKGLREQLDDLIMQYGRGPKGAGAFKEAVSSGYKNLGQVYDKAGVRAADLLDDIIRDPKLTALKTDYPQLAQQIDDEVLAMASKIDRGTWRNAYAGWLKEIAQKGRAADDILAPAAVRGQVAQAFRDKLGMTAEALRAQAGTGQSLGELGQLVRAEHAIKGPLERMATSVGAGAREGSQTAPRMLAALGPKQLGGAVLGAGLGAVPGKPEKGASPAEWAAYIVRIMGAGVLGGALGRAGANAINTIAAPALTGISSAMPILAGAGRAAGAMGGVQPALTGKAETPLAKTLTGQPEQIEQSEQQVGPQKVEEAKQQTNAAFQDRVMSELQKAWVGLQQAGTRLTFDEFTGLVRQYTNDFDPKLSAPILFRDPKERERYLKTYENALAFGGMDIESAFAPSGLLDSGKAEKQMARQTLQNWMAGLVAGPERMASRDIQDLVQQDIEAISKLRIPAQEKRRMLRQILQTNYGLDFDLLSQYGVTA